MPSDNVHHRRERLKYSVVFIPSDESARTRSISIGLLGGVGLILASFFVIVLLGVVVLVYTPVGSLLPVSKSKVEQTYGKQIVQIERQLQMLMQEMIVLRDYNVRLRRALGEKISSGDSMMAQQVSREDSLARLPGEAPGNQNVVRDLTLTQQPASGISPNVESKEIKQPENNGRTQLFPLSVPADGYETRRFNPDERHYGIDIASKEGSAVLAAADGTVEFAGWTYDDGFTIVLGHSQGYTTVYKHNQALLKSAGLSIKRGDVIALLGNTGKTSSGPHLHFEVWKDGVVYNPDNYLLTTQ